jgi:hypothetical protein
LPFNGHFWGQNLALNKEKSRACCQFAAFYLVPKPGIAKLEMKSDS